GELGGVGGMERRDLNGEAQSAQRRAEQILRYAPFEAPGKQDDKTFLSEISGHGRGGFGGGRRGRGLARRWSCPGKAGERWRWRSGLRRWGIGRVDSRSGCGRADGDGAG